MKCFKIKTQHCWFKLNNVSTLAFNLLTAKQLTQYIHNKFDFLFFTVHLYFKQQQKLTAMMILYDIILKKNFLTSVKLVSFFFEHRALNVL